MKNILILTIAAFVVFCGVLIAESGLFEINCGDGQACILLQQTTVDERPGRINAPVKKEMHLEAAVVPAFSAVGGPATTVTLGSLDPKSGFNFQLELSSKGAAITKAAFSRFDDRDYKDPQPLVILSPIADEIFSMANRQLVFVQQKLQLPLNKLHWKSSGVEKDYDGSQTARFEAIITDTAGEAVVRLIKTYKVMPDSYLLDCNITIENLSASEQKVRFNLTGPVGIGREAARADMRKAVAGFRDSQGQVTGERLGVKKLLKAKTIDDRRLIKPGAKFLWAAAVNKYFAAILVPVPDEGKDYCDWVIDKTGVFYNPDRDSRGDSGDETVGVDLRIAQNTLAAAGQTGGTKQYNFQLYLGPKDKNLFDKND